MLWDCIKIKFFVVENVSFIIGMSGKMFGFFVEYEVIRFGFWIWSISNMLELKDVFFEFVIFLFEIWIYRILEMWVEKVD